VELWLCEAGDKVQGPLDLVTMPLSSWPPDMESPTHVTLQLADPAIPSQQNFNIEVFTMMGHLAGLGHELP
jgi:hypothetical protein